MDAGMAIGAYVLGIVASAVGYRSIYLIGVVLIIATGLLYFVLTKKKDESNVYVENEYEEIA